MPSLAAELDAYRRLDELLAALIAPAAPWSSDIALRLERMELLVAGLGHPERGYATVHVGGTSGKGSVAAMVAAMLTAHGRRTGLHLSPYVQTLTESWQLDGRYALPSRMLEIVDRVVASGAPIATALPFGPASYFETKVAAAFQLFHEEEVDAAVVEVGLGGALDATNVLGPGVQVLTSVGLDHTEILGDTIEQIAADKVQIFKPDSVVVSGVEQPAAIEIARERARAVGSPLYLLDHDVQWRRAAAGRLDVTLDGTTSALALPAAWPDFMSRNAALAVAAARLALAAEFDAAAAGRALATVQLPGRLEQFAEAGRTVILDGAHNPEKIRATAAYLRARYPSPRVGVVALKESKDAEAVLAELAPLFDAFVLTTFRAGLWQATPPEQLAVALQRLGYRGLVELRVDPRQAFEAALGLAAPGDTIVVTGSLYLAGNLRPRWRPQADELESGTSYRVTG